MKRSELLAGAAVAGATCISLRRAGFAADAPRPISKLNAPAGGANVAFLVSDGAVMIDFAGPWEVFQDASPPGVSGAAFNLYTVAPSKTPISVSGGATLVPNYDLQSAPRPHVVVIPGQGQASPGMLEWLRAVAPHADVVMSVCTGAFVLAASGLLDGHDATTHHGSFARLAMEYPKIAVKRGARYVDEGRVASAGGLTSGIDLAMHIVERYYGREAVDNTAYYMEYQGQGWKDPSSNRLYAKPPVARLGYALCPVCWMEVDPKAAPSSVYNGKSYYFCMPAHKQLFDANPARILAA